MKADAAVDREDRSVRQPERADEHLRRRNAFQADVFDEVRQAKLGNGLDGKVLALAVTFLKKARAERVKGLLRAAGAPIP